MNCPHTSISIARVNVKVSDTFQLRVGKKVYNGYVPPGIGLNDGMDGDYIRFRYCLSCGLIISPDFPVSAGTLREIFPGSLALAAMSGHR